MPLVRVGQKLREWNMGWTRQIEHPRRMVGVPPTFLASARSLRVFRTEREKHCYPIPHIFRLMVSSIQK